MSERPSHDSPQQPFELPTDLAEFLRGQDIACLMQETSHGTAFVVKMPSADIVTARGMVPIGLRHELIAHPQAPVIRTVLTIYDQAEPMALETFTNVAVEQQAADFRRLAQQPYFVMAFYDEQVRHQLTKVVPQPRDEQVERIVDYAERLRAAIPAEQYDFDEAKRAVIERRRL